MTRFYKLLTVLLALCCFGCGGTTNDFVVNTTNTTTTSNRPALSGRVGEVRFQSTLEPNTVLAQEVVVIESAVIPVGVTDLRFTTGVSL